MRRATCLALLAVLAVPTPALASGDDVIRDCTYDGRVDERYSQKEYRDALNNMPADVDEYTDCRDEIRRAKERALTGSGGGGGDVGVSGPGGVAPGGVPLDEAGAPVDPLALADQGEKNAIGRAAEGRFASEEGPTIAPADRLDLRVSRAGVAPGQHTTELPWLLVALVAALGLGAVAGAGRTLWSVVRARRQS